MKSEDVDHVIDFLVPGLLETKENGSMSVSGNTSWTQLYHGVLYSREYRYHDMVKTVSADINAGAACLSEKTARLETEYGTPDYEEFSRPPVHVGASYEWSKGAKLIELHAWRLITLRDSSAEPTGPNPVEQFINNFLPETASPGKPCGSTSPARCVEFHGFVMRKMFDEHDSLVDITIKFQ